MNSRTLTGAWIETCTSILLFLFWLVAPSRVRGLKLHGDRTMCSYSGRTLTGAWIETPIPTFSVIISLVAPSRVRGLKQQLET